MEKLSIYICINIDVLYIHIIQLKHNYVIMEAKTKNKESNRQILK